MKYIKDFLKNKDITKTEIFEHLECSVKEANILKDIFKSFINGIEEVLIRDIIVNIDDKERDVIDCLDNIKYINNLIELGWLHKSSNIMNKNDDFSLEIFSLNHTVTLTHSFLTLIENGKDINDQKDSKMYSDNLEYIQDQFIKVELYHQKSLILGSSSNKNKSRLDKFEQKIASLENVIAKKLKNSKIKLPLKSFIEDNELDSSEELVFLALLREEYISSDNNLRDMNVLINLVSSSSYDKIKNRSIFEENNKLISKEIISYEDILVPFGGISRTFFITEDVLHQVMNSTKKKSEKIKIESAIESQDIFELIKPKYNLKYAVLEKDIEDKLDTILKRLDKKVVERLINWGIKEEDSGIDSKIIFYGVPGTGKTFTAHCLAKSLNKNILNFDCSKILSMYVGESEKNVRSIFDTYKDICKKTEEEPILFLNEADQFLSSRGNVASGVDQMHNQIQNIFLDQIENFDGILIATTNLLDNIDKAFSRRFDYKIEFKKPTLKQREALFKQFLPKNAKYEEDVNVKELIKDLAKYELTGGQIKLVVKNTSYKVAIRAKETFYKQDFIDEIKIEKSTSFGDDKSLGFMS